MPRDLLATGPKDLLAGNDLLIDDDGPQAVQTAQRLDLTSATPVERAISFFTGGIAPTVGGAREAEKSAPIVGGVVGSALGTMIGKPNVGLGFGVGLGNLVQQTAEKLKDPNSDIDVNDAVILGGSAAAGGKIFDLTLKTAGISMKLVPEKARAKLFDKALQAVNIGRKQLQRNWERSVTSLTEKFPDKRINLKPVMMKLKAQFDGVDESLIPQLKSAVKKNKRLSEVVDDTDKAIGLTLKEAQDLKNAVTSSVKPITKRSLKGQTLPTERVVFEVLDDFDDAIVSEFPQMSLIKRAYRSGRNSFDLARPLVEPGKPVEAAILSRPQGLFGLGGTPLFGSTQGKLAAKDILSQTNAGARLFESLKLAHNVNRAADAVGRLGQIAFGGSLARKFVIE